MCVGEGGTGLLTESIASVTLDVPLSLIPSYLSDGVGYLLGSLRKEGDRASAFKVRLTRRGRRSSWEGSLGTRPHSRGAWERGLVGGEPGNGTSWEGILGTRPCGRGAWERGYVIHVYSECWNTVQPQ